MWVAKFEVLHKGCLVAPKCKKHNINLYSYFLKSWRDNNKFYYSELYLLKGDKRNKNKFINDLKKESQIKKIIRDKDLLFVLTEEKYNNQEKIPLFEPSLLQSKPIFINTLGFEEWEFAHWNRKLLMNILNLPKNILNIKLKSIKKLELEEIFISKTFPRLPKKQKQAIELAIEGGYYDFPKKIHLESLAKKVKVSSQTYRENLRRSEKKLLSFMVGNLNS
jgi:predicted DNA binding protein